MSYSPKIKQALVRELYLLKHSNSKKTPMTKLVNEAVEEYLAKKREENGKEQSNENSTEDYRISA
jgi:uncharacterized protein YfaQ (DUF2300 family)